MMQKLIPVLCGLVLYSVVPTESLAQNPPRGFISLFNGKDLSGWKATAKAEVWGAENGVLFCSGKGGGWLLTEKEYGNFELRLEYKLPRKGNSGVAIRTPFKGDPAYVGMELQLIDDEGWPNKLEAGQHTGSIYKVVPAATTANKPVGEWNRMRVVAHGRRVTVELNGVVLVNANLDDYREHVQKYPGLERAAGHIGFQSYNYRVEFRNIYLRPVEQDIAQGDSYGGRIGLLGRIRQRFGR